MRMRLRLELQTNGGTPLGTVTWQTPGPFTTATEINTAFNRLFAVLAGFDLRRRINMLRSLADDEIIVSAPPDITIL